MVALLLLSVSPGLVSGAQDVSASDDAYHYGTWENGEHDGNYTEWWYFNFYDSKQNVEAIVSYFVTDPQNLTGFGQSQVAAVVYTPAGTIRELDSYPATAFSASSDRASVQIAGNSVASLTAGTYHILGQSSDNRLQWDLLYLRQSAPWFAADRMPVGDLSWESMSWLVYMPRATVVGRVLVDGQTYVVNAPGYHDHNWGEWIFSNAMWNWAQYSQPGFVFDLGDFIGGSAGVASIELLGERTTFAKNQYSLIHTKWALDAENQKWYPIESVFSANNGSVKLVLSMHVLNTEPLRGNLPFPFPDVIIYEQTATYQGLVVNSSNNARVLSFPFQGFGFKEYTAKTRSNP